MGETKNYSIAVNDAVVVVTEFPDMFSDDEEADTLLPLHVHQALKFSAV